MKSRRRLLPLFFLFLLLAGGLFLVSSTGFGKGLTGMLEQLVLPLQRVVFHSVRSESRNTPESQLREENTKLYTQLAKMEDIKKENKALSDQFKKTEPAPSKLVPAQIIGTKDDAIILDKGSNAGIKVGEVLVVKDTAVGRIAKVSANRSIGELITKSDTSITVKTAKTSALGIGRGRGGGKFVIDNVVLADKLEKNDLVVTKGDVDENGVGYPPDLIIGKIVSINKKTSELFQTAEVEPLVNFEKMEMVFVMVE